MQIVEERGFRVAYDPDVPAVSVRWAPPPYALSRALDDVRNVDYGHDGQPAAAEFLYVDDGVDLRGVPRAEAFAPLLERLGIRITHPPEAPPAGRVLARAVADQVVAYRARHGISIRALAAQLEMQHPAVVRLERGERAPTLETVERLAGRLGVQFLVLIGPNRDPAPPLPAGFDLVGRSAEHNRGVVLVAAHWGDVHEIALAEGPAPV
jgi:transcriptional regulator with XRE-family HTH domain